MVPAESVLLTAALPKSPVPPVCLREEHHVHTSLSPPLSTADRSALSSWNLMAFALYAASPDPWVRDDIAAANNALATHCARRFVHRGEPFDDLQQVARLGLVLAIDRFDGKRGVPFGAYATATIMGELRRHFRDKTWGVHVPRRPKDLCGAVAGATSALQGDLGRHPTTAEVAARTALTEATVLEVGQAINARWIASLASTTQPVRSLTSMPGGELSDEVVDRVVVGEMLSGLGPRQRQIMELRFYDEFTQSQIAEQMGLSQVHVGRLLAEGLERMRRSAAAKAARSEALARAQFAPSN